MTFSDDPVDFMEEPTIPLVVIATEAAMLDRVQELDLSGLFAITVLGHDAPADSECQGVILFEIRLMEAFEDLNVLRTWRQKRPLQPILALCGNDDEDFILEAYKAGSTFYLIAATPTPVLTANLRVLHKLSEAPRMVEIQNHEMLRSMNAERTATEAKMQAEGARRLAQAQAEANQRTRDILDNLHEGFFIVEKDLRIAETVSHSCEDIFKRHIAGQVIGESLGLAPGVELFLQNGLEQLFEDFMPLELNLSLLPKRLITEDERILTFTYTPILTATHAPARLIIEANDVTENIRDQKAFAQIQRMNECLLAILSDKDPFKDFLADTKKEIEVLAAAPSEAIGKRLLHTLKGNSAVMGLEVIAEYIHQLETELSGLPESETAAFFVKSAACIEDKFRSFLHDHAGILQINWGEYKHSYTLTEAELNFLTYYVKHDRGLDKDTTLHILKRLRLRTVKSMLVGFDSMVKRRAEQLGKNIRFHLIGAQIRLDPKRFTPLMKALVHALRNGCDHGIESPDEREHLGKEVKGYIQFKFEVIENSSLRITIQDDGGGIQTAKLLQSAIDKKMIDEDEARSLSHEETLHLVFRDGLSTAEELTETSGRGVGMACIRFEVEDLQGQLKIKSKEQVGTLYEIVIPNFSAA